jgi:hypothetical protein
MNSFDHPIVSRRNLSSDQQPCCFDWHIPQPPLLPYPTALHITYRIAPPWLRAGQTIVWSEPPWFLWTINHVIRWWATLFTFADIRQKERLYLSSRRASVKCGLVAEVCTPWTPCSSMLPAAEYCRAVLQPIHPDLLSSVITRSVLSRSHGAKRVSITGCARKLDLGGAWWLQN